MLHFQVDPSPFTVAITPYLPILGVIAGALLVGIFAAYNRRKGNIETRAPDVNEIWLQQAEQSKQLDLERRIRRRMEDIAREFRRAFRNYVRRVQAGGSTDLTAHERKLYEVDVPTSEINLDDPK